MEKVLLRTSADKTSAAVRKADVEIELEKLWVRHRALVADNDDDYMI